MKQLLGMSAAMIAGGVLLSAVSLGIYAVVKPASIAIGLYGGR